MNISFVGLGYVGLVSAVAMADFGHNIIGIDSDQEKLNKLNNKILPIDEVGLEAKFIKHIQLGKIHFSNNYTRVSNSDAIFITVGTPAKHNGESDLSFIYTALDHILQVIKSESLIIVKSTVPPKTCQTLQQYIYDSGKANEITSNPEFLKEGKALFDFTHPDRLVFGCKSLKAASVLKKIYHPLISRKIPFIITDPTTSELIKIASNSFLATKIAFINEMANLCQEVKADVDQLARGIGLDKRIGKEFLKVGPGFGGSCFPKDNSSLLETTKLHGCKSMLIEAVINSNKERIEKIIGKIKSILGKIDGKTLTVLGLTFKAETDDTRDSPSIKLIHLLLAANAYIKAYDPKAKLLNKELLNNRHFTRLATINEAIEESEAIIIATEWKEFIKFDYKAMIKLKAPPIIIDLRNILKEKRIMQLGLKYFAIGKGI